MTTDINENGPRYAYEIGVLRSGPFPLPSDDDAAIARVKSFMADAPEEMKNLLAGNPEALAKAAFLQEGAERFKAICAGVPEGMKEQLAHFQETADRESPRRLPSISIPRIPAIPVLSIPDLSSIPTLELDL